MTPAPSKIDAEKEAMRSALFETVTALAAYERMDRYAYGQKAVVVMDAMKKALAECRAALPPKGAPRA